jgi:hypothetical protein
VPKHSNTQSGHVEGFLKIHASSAEWQAEAKSSQCVPEPSEKTSKRPTIPLKFITGDEPWVYKYNHAIK